MASQSDADDYTVRLTAHLLGMTSYGDAHGQTVTWPDHRFSALAHRLDEAQVTQTSTTAFKAAKAIEKFLETAVTVNRTGLTGVFEDIHVNQNLIPALVSIGLQYAERSPGVSLAHHDAAQNLAASSQLERK